MSQVKNLRAMFEQKGDSSPPDRGRVQQGLPAQPADSPRPLSRVRTSFVTVEKDGRVGLQRDTSSDSIPTLSRTISAGTESDVAVPAAPQDKGEAAVKLDEPKTSVVPQTPKRIPAPIPEESTPVTQPKAVLPVSPAKPAKDATPKPAPRAEVKVSAPTPIRNGAERGLTSPTKAALGDKSLTPSPRKLFTKPVGSTESQAASGTLKKTLDVPAASEPKTAPEQSTNGAASKPEPRNVVASSTANGSTNGTAKDAATPSAATKTKPAPSSSIPLHPKVKDSGPKTTSTRTTPNAISTAKANTKPSTKSPGMAVKTPTAKTPTSPAKSLTPKLPVKAASERKTHETTSTKATTVPVAPKLTAPKTTMARSSTSAASSTKGKPAPIATFPSNGIGFVKPKPKSPTRPVQLPSSLTTHTASSATKANVPRQSLSRQSGNFLSLHPPSAAASSMRSPSRTSVTSGTTNSALPHGKTLRRQSSTVSRPRPSIGPPPKQSAHDHPVTKREKEVDEGFLARMMRPTQASARKTADKAQLSPPRKQHSTVVPATTSTTNSTRRSFAPRESTAAPAKKTTTAAKAPLSLPPRPPACITVNPAFAAEKTPTEKVVEVTKEAVAVPDVVLPEPITEEVTEEAVEGSVEEPIEEPVEEKPVEEIAEAEVVEDAPAGKDVAEETANEVVVEEEEEETPVEDDVAEEAINEEESHEEVPEEVPEEESAVEPASEEPFEAVDEGTAAKAVHPGHAAEAVDEAVEESDTSAIEAGVAAQ